MKVLLLNKIFTVKKKYLKIVHINTKSYKKLIGTMKNNKKITYYNNRL